MENMLITGRQNNNLAASFTILYILLNLRGIFYFNICSVM